MMRSTRRPLIYLALIALLAILLAAITYAAEFAALPDALEGVVRVIYRPVYLLLAPFHYLSRLIDFPADRHWPVWQLPAVALAGAVFHTYLFLGCRRIFRALAHGRAATMPVEADLNLNRRQFLVRAGAGTVAVTGAATAAHASLIAPQQLAVRRYDLPMVDLPAALDGLRIVHISDTHYGPFIGLPYLQGVVAQVNALKPDFIALTGDYTHRSPRTIDPGIGVLAGLKARLGIAAVLGNHDHWEGAQACRDRFASFGVPMVDNTRLFLSPEGLSHAPREAALCVSGLGDYWEGTTDHAAALDGVPEAMPRIVLAHNPDSAEADANGRRMDLMLSGHTHGGQIAVPWRGALVVPSAYGTKYAGGWVGGPQCPVIVSRGVGMTVMPIRFLVPPEIGVIALRRV